MNENQWDYDHIMGYAERLFDDIRRVEGVTNPERLTGLQKDALYIAHRLEEWATKLSRQRFQEIYEKLKPEIEEEKAKITKE